MAKAKMVIRQRDFSGGELDPNALRRDDTKIFKAALRRVRNMRPLATGGLTRRPGRRIVYFDGGLHDIVRPVSDAAFDVTFAALRFTARLRGTGAVVSDLVAPWTADQLPDIVWEPVGRRIFVCHREFAPQVLEYDRDAGTWSISTFDFRTTLSGAYKAAFYRFADFGVTMQPSALSGAITLTFSAAVLKATHVNEIFRYAGRQVRITAVDPGLASANATVIEPLPPTFRVTMASVAGYKVGEIVEGDTSGARGEVIAIDTGAGKLDVLMVKGYSGFTNSEILVGSEGGSTVTSSTTTGPAFAATVQWDEQFMSDSRGWPGSVSSDVSRLIFCDFAQLEDAIIWSAIGSPDDLEITGEADGAIFERVPAVCRVLHVAGGADEFVLTDTGIYYIPITGDTPLAPGSVEFRRIGSAGAARVKPVASADGLIFIGETLTRVYAIVATGQVTRPYEVRAINRFHEHLFNAPVAIAASDGDSAANPGQHVYVVNGDGTIVVGHGGTSEEFIGWFPWTGAGAALSVAARYGDVIFTVRYTLEDAATVDAVETIDADQMFDGAIPLIDFVGSDPIRDSTGDPIRDSTGEPYYAVNGAALPFANETMQAWADGYFLGEITVDANGAVSIPDTDLSNVTLGWNFTPEIQPFIEDFEGGEAFGQRLTRRKVSKVVLTVKDTQTFQADGRVFGSYVVGEDWGQVPPARSASYSYRQTGRSHDPQVEISQPIPGSFTLLESTIEVTV